MLPMDWKKKKIRTVVLNDANTVLESNFSYIEKPPQGVCGVFICGLHLNICWRLDLENMEQVLTSTLIQKVVIMHKAPANETSGVEWSHDEQSLCHPTVISFWSAGWHLASVGPAFWSQTVFYIFDTRVQNSIQLSTECSCCQTATFQME